MQGYVGKIPVEMVLLKILELEGRGGYQRRHRCEALHRPRLAPFHHLPIRPGRYIFDSWLHNRVFNR